MKEFTKADGMKVHVNPGDVVTVEDVPPYVVGGVPTPKPSQCRIIFWSGERVTVEGDAAVTLKKLDKDVKDLYFLTWSASQIHPLFDYSKAYELLESAEAQRTFGDLFCVSLKPENAVYFFDELKKLLGLNDSYLVIKTAELIRGINVPQRRVKPDVK